MNPQVFDTDVLVVGAGGAGCRAAIQASEHNVQVTVITKDLLGKAHTSMAEGGMNAALANVDSQDNWEIHGRDTCSAGAYLNNQELVEILVTQAPERVMDLENYGAVFSRTPDGLIAQRPFGHQTYRRTCYAGDRTGSEILSTLVEEIRRRDIDVHDEVFATSILATRRRAAGITAINIRTGEMMAYRAKATIMAMGGAGRVYEVTTNAAADVGSGYAMAYKAGVELIDMEQFQFHPTSVAFPEAARGRLVTEGVRGEGGVLLNKHGERFMEKYNPKLMDLAGRDQVARSIATEIREGRGTEHNAVYLDISYIPSRIIESRLPTMLEDFLDLGLDIREEPTEVSPSAHHVMGGIKIDKKAGTNLQGLYAAGEGAGGVHGGNRVGGNALAGINVFGAIAGDSAAEFAATHEMPRLSRSQIAKESRRIHEPLKRKDAVTHFGAVKELRRLMWDNVGLYRSRESLTEALRRIEEMQKKLWPTITVGNKSTRYNNEWINTLELSDMLLVAEMITRPALLREESRGAHFRTDFPNPNNDAWFKNIVLAREDGGMQLKAVPVVVTKWPPPWSSSSPS
ncbi:MAG: FAD-binding protein [Nitrososphaeria archaeon]